ncbi:TonB family C-terminal domain-containing protein [Malonomonas rubra DSM 5091]|uniref:TonB family C-terminal domain-containing protein n=1 Tax=Malonomonas rubra DSM 5091 TaxID=1122189 RepID=A0A1M6BFY8_MALRU|nr:energy transducer TonB [Malonomonas rubra]SHI47615.1 TonB family C-terminal domain-containing protein [Malonomonas rubra DSM 5091]
MYYSIRFLAFILLSLSIHLLLLQFDVLQPGSKLVSGLSEGVSLLERSNVSFRQIEKAPDKSPKKSHLEQREATLLDEENAKQLQPKEKPIAAPDLEASESVTKESVTESISQSLLLSSDEFLDSVELEPLDSVVGAASISVSSSSKVVDEYINQESVSSKTDVLTGSEQFVGYAGELEEIPVFEPGTKSTGDGGHQQIVEPLFLQALPRYDINPPPIYPDIARRRGQQGRVELKVLVEKDGSVGKLKVETSSGYKALDRAALRAVRFWTFKPALDYGLPIESWVIVPVDFVLD